MSLGSEIFMQRALSRLADASGAEGVALVSRYGLAIPSADACAPLARVAAEPMGGLRSQPVSVYAPPARIDEADGARILARYPLALDMRGGFDPAALASLPAPALLRRPRGGAPPGGMSLVFDDPEGGDAVFARDGLDFGDAAARLDPTEDGFIDEFAEYRVDGARGPIVARRFVRREMEVAVHPASCLRSPNAAQIAAALTTGSALANEDVGFVLAIPGVAAGGARFRLEIETAGDIATADAEAVAQVELRPTAAGWIVTGDVDPGAEAGLIDLTCSATAALSAVWIAVARRRGRWEVWDEADAQLRLEESW